MVKLSLLIKSFVASLLLITLISAASMNGYGASFLRAPVGTRAFAMGGAQSVNPDYAVSWWNPAALSFLKTKRAVLGGGFKSLGRTEAYLSFDAPLPPRMGLGGTILYRGISTIDNLYDAQEYKINDASYSTITGKFGLSYLITKRVSAGLSFSFIYQKLPTDYSGIDILYTKETSFGGIDLAVKFNATKKLGYAFLVKNLLAQQTLSLVQISENGGEMTPTVTDTFPLIAVVSQEFKGEIAKRAFVWDADISGYFINSKFKQLEHSHVVIDNGFEWQAWKTFSIRFGLGDFEINTDMFSNSGSYWDSFSLVAAGGFGFNLSSLLGGLNGKELIFNCAIANDKVGAGAELQMDISFGF